MNWDETLLLQLTSEPPLVLDPILSQVLLIADVWILQLCLVSLMTLPFVNEEGATFQTNFVIIFVNWVIDFHDFGS